jgi:hypothetical protein
MEYRTTQKSYIFWDITPFRSVERQPTFRRKMSPQSLGSKNIPEKKPAELPICFKLDFHGLFFDPEFGGDIFLRNIGRLSAYCMELYPRI